MAFTTVTMTNHHTGAIKSAPVGFAWTVFFFSFMPAMFRGDIKNLFIMMMFQVLTLGLAALYFMFRYNRMYIKSLVSDGFKLMPLNRFDHAKVNKSVGINVPMMEVE